MLTRDEMPACPVATTVQLIGSKWKLLILRNLRMRPWRFNELRKNLEGISQKVLTDSLRAMESDGIVTRTVYPEVPPRVEYSLTPLGESMSPILDAMEDLGITDFQDSDGRINTYYTYLKLLNEYHTIPVVISEYGVSTGRGMAQRDAKRDMDRAMKSYNR